jgi:hypothetical protein
VTWNLFMYGAGWACLGAITIIAAVIFVESLYHRWPQIMTALRGNDRPGFVPLSRLPRSVPSGLVTPRC